MLLFQMKWTLIKSQLNLYWAGFVWWRLIPQVYRSLRGYSGNLGKAQDKATISSIIKFNNDLNNPSRVKRFWRVISYPFRYSQHKGFWSHLGWGLVATGLALAAVLAVGLVIGAAVVSHGASIPFTVAAKGVFVSAGKWVGMHLASKVATAGMFTSASAAANAGAFVAGAAVTTTVVAATLGAAALTPGDAKRAGKSSGAGVGNSFQSKHTKADGVAFKGLDYSAPSAANSPLTEVEASLSLVGTAVDLVLTKFDEDTTDEDKA